MLQLKNATPFKANITLFADPEGIDTLYITLKATFEPGNGIQPAEVQVAVLLADDFWGPPGASSIRYAADVHLVKPATDVVLVGSAWAPNGRPTPVVDVGLTVAERKKMIRVFGDRFWRDDSAVSPPQPFERMPLVFERAFGGAVTTAHDPPKVLAEEKNPVGRGFLGGRNPRDRVEQPLPNLEDPQLLVQQAGDRAVPACFAFIAPGWLPRRAFAGTYDAAWQKGRAPFLPENFDLRFFHAAAAEFVFDRYLQGGEAVHILNACPQGRLSFTLPRCAWEVKAKVAGTSEDVPVHLETVLIEPDENRFCLTWRGAVPCDKKALKIEEVSVDLRQISEA